MLAIYAATTGTTADEAWQVEANMGRQWRGDGYKPADIEARRRAIIDRGRDQVS